MSIKGKAQTLFVGKGKITIQTFLEKEVCIFYENLKSVDYQYADNPNFGFMRFKQGSGNRSIFVFTAKSNEPISRTVEYISEKAPLITITEVNEKFGTNECFFRWPLYKKALLFIITFIAAFSCLMYWFNPFADQGDTGRYITFQEFNDCKTGMTYAECVKIIGSEGELMAQSNIIDTESTAYIWYGDSLSGANAEIYFMDGKLFSKSQFGLQ